MEPGGEMENAVARDINVEPVCIAPPATELLDLVIRVAHRGG